MKKLLILASLCLSMSISAFAQGYGRPNNGQRMPFQFDAVVDTAIINHIGLEADKLQQVYKLQETKQSEQREMFQGARRERGQRMSEEERQAMQEKRQAFTNEYRKQLRAIIGDQLYITYLEKMLDRQASMRFGRMGGGPRGGQGFNRGGGDNGFGGGNNGFGGNDGFGGGGF